jgi:hypothetical protein
MLLLLYFSFRHVHGDVKYENILLGQPVPGAMASRLSFLPASVAWCAALFGLLVRMANGGWCCTLARGRWPFGYGGGARDHQDTAAAPWATEGHCPPHWRCNERPEPHGRGSVVLLVAFMRLLRRGRSVKRLSSILGVSLDMLAGNKAACHIRWDTCCLLSPSSLILQLAASSINKFDLAPLLQLVSQRFHLQLNSQSCHL